MIDFDTAYDVLAEQYGVSEDTLAVVTSINGNTVETLESVLYVVTGYRSFSQLEDEDD